MRRHWLAVTFLLGIAVLAIPENWTDFGRRLLGDLVASPAQAQRGGFPNYGWFYRFVVELTYDNEPVDIEVIVSCASQERQILGEGRSVRAVWAPYIFGVRVKDRHGVLVQSPAVCDRDVSKDPLPGDFLPVVFWAPDADNLEFLIAYLHERSYEQPFAKLKFRRATVTEATEADYRRWRDTKWKQNIVPIGDASADRLRGASFFRGEGFFPERDIRNLRLLRMECWSYVRLPLSEALRTKVREHWPASRPSYWLLDRTIASEIVFQRGKEIAAEARKRNLWRRDEPRGLPTFFTGTGINRLSGIGHLEKDQSEFVSGEALRIPYRVETGYPWADDRLFKQSTIDVNVDAAGGADQGFGYCYRDIYQRYFRGRTVAHRFFIDGQLIGTWQNAQGQAPGAAIVERDEYVWHHTKFPLTHELARMQ